MRLASRLQSRNRPGVTLIEVVVASTVVTIIAGFTFMAFNAAQEFGNKVDAQVNSAIVQLAHNAPKFTPPPPRINTPAPPPAPTPDVVPCEYQITFNPSVRNPLAEAQRLAALVGGQVVAIYTNTFYGFTIRCSDASVRLLSSDHAVKLIDQARYIYPCAAPANIKRVFSNGIDGRSATLPVRTIFGTPREKQQMIISQTSSRHPRVQVAILDTGIDSTHPDLVVVDGVDYTQSSPIAIALSSRYNDIDGHGTHVAGIVGALDRSGGQGVVGVYPGAPLISLKVMTAGLVAGASSAGTTTTVIAALEQYVIPAVRSNGFHGHNGHHRHQFQAAPNVCLLAFAPKTMSVTLKTAVSSAASLGVLMVAASGSASTSVWNGTQAIVVGALIDSDGLPNGYGETGDDTPAPYSSISGVDFMAPGGSPAARFYLIRSTVPGGGYSTTVNGTPGRDAQGTSFAAAHVAGMLALVMDPHTSIGQPSLRNTMTSKSGAVNGLRRLTCDTTPFQMVNPITGSQWIQTRHSRQPYLKSLNSDTVGGVSVPNFYQGPATAPAFLLPFPG